MTTPFDRTKILTLVAVAALLVVDVYSAPVAADSDAEKPAVGESLLDLSLQELLDLRLSDRPVIGLHHVHPQGEWMLAFRDGHMDMHHLKDGRREVQDEDLFELGYRVAPESMSTHMKMAEAMYGLSDRVTLMAMVPYLDRRMHHTTVTGGSFETRSSGIGDVSLSALVGSTSSAGHATHWSMGLFLPTGSIDRRDSTPAGPGRKLPYRMQTGSGSVAIKPGFTYARSGDQWLAGIHFSHKIYLGRNDAQYRLGDESRLDLWAVREWNEKFTLSMRFQGLLSQNIHGADPELNPGMVPTADPKLQGIRRLDAAVGVSAKLPYRLLRDSRLVLEYAHPIYESLDGPQLSVQHRWGFSLQKIF